ncbi:MAG: class I SAM-dependent methyltransferase, partial [Comamonas sp.]
MENLPAWLFEQARRNALTLADWGCAQGDGTDVLASHVDSRQVTGIDFSEVAIAQAAGRYPALRFVTEDWLAPSGHATESFDIVFSSNTLEHFHRPWEVLQALGERATKAVALALPYREIDRIDEHFYSFLPDNVPMVLPNGFRLVWSRVVDCRPIPDTLWGGEQIFLVYAAQDWIDQLKLSLGDVEIDHDGAAAKTADLRQRLAALDSHIAATARQDAQIDQLRQAITAQDTRINGLNQTLIERERQAAAEAVATAATAAANAAAAAAEHAAQIAVFNNAVAERDEQIAELRKEHLVRAAQLASLNTRLF